MGEYKNFEEVKLAIENAKTDTDIGLIFRNIFNGNYYLPQAFTKEASKNYEFLEDTLAKLHVKDALTATDIYELSQRIRSAYISSSKIEEEILEQHPEYQYLFDKKDDYKLEDLKNEAVKSGEEFITAHAEDAVQLSNEIADNSKKLQDMASALKGDNYSEAREYFISRIRDEVQKYFKKDVFGISSWVTNFTQKEDWYGPEGWSQYKKFLELRGQILAEMKEKFGDYKEQYENAVRIASAVEQKTKDLFEKITFSLSKAGNISEEQASDWATRNVYIDKSVERKLAKIKYSKEQLLKDMAELYRYLGGKLGPVEFLATRKRRAFAYSERMQIAISDFFDKRTLFHECGHLSEGLNKLCLNCSYQFRDSRASGSLQSLKSITGNPAYSANEKAYPDNFINPYVGKVYDHEGSEVFSMGIENMSSPEKLANFIQKDPEHFKLCLGVCLYNNPSMARKIQTIMDSKRQKYDSATSKTKTLEQWYNAIDKAIPKDLLLQLLSRREGYENYKIETFGNSTSAKGNLYYKDDSAEEGRDPWSYLAGGKNNDVLKAAYLLIMYERGKISFEGVGGDRKSFANSICSNYLRSGIIPDWFDPNQSLPKLEISKDDTGIAQKKSSKVFLAALKKAIPANMFEELKKTGGIDGFSIVNWATPKDKVLRLYFHYKEDDEEGVFVKSRALLPMAYLMIMNNRNLLPEHYDTFFSAQYRFIDYANGRDVPDWFEPEQGLPRLEI